MTQVVRLREEADQDLAGAATWYEEQRVGLGAEFLDEVLAACETISQNPLLYPEVYGNVRRMLMPRFPFGIYFRINNDHVVVFAIMHASRDPTRWQTRG